MSNTGGYGQYYWCIKSLAAADGEIYIHADRIEVTPAGALIAWGPEDRFINLTLASGQWTCAYAAAIADGAAVAVEHWGGEVRR